jgi:hypothetical protein
MGHSMERLRFFRNRSGFVHFFSKKMNCACLYAFEVDFPRAGWQVRTLTITHGYRLPCVSCRAQPLCEFLIVPLICLIQSYFELRIGKCHSCSCVSVDGEYETLSAVAVQQFDFPRLSEHRLSLFPDFSTPMVIVSTTRRAWFTHDHLVFTPLILTYKPRVPRCGSHWECPRCAEDISLPWRGMCFGLSYLCESPTLRGIEMKLLTKGSCPQYAPTKERSWVLHHDTFRNPFRALQLESPPRSWTT